jgi:hypothetical protein
VHEPKSIAVSENSSGEISIGSNSPNPFSDKTLIPVNLKSDCNVTVQIVDILGRTIAMPYEHTAFTAGTHQIRIDGSSIKDTGSYYCLVSITDPATGNIIASSRQTLIFR